MCQNPGSIGPMVEVSEQYHSVPVHHDVFLDKCDKDWMWIVNEKESVELVDGSWNHGVN